LAKDNPDTLVQLMDHGLTIQHLIDTTGKNGNSVLHWLDQFNKETLKILIRDHKLKPNWKQKQDCTIM